MKKTFAETIANAQFPKKKKDQSMVLNTIEDLSQLECIWTLNKLTSSNNIKFV
jgi:hypothetical protein